MRTKTKIWLGVGAFVMAGSPAADSGPIPQTGRAGAATLLESSALTDAGATAAARRDAAGIVLAQHGHSGEAERAASKAGKPKDANQGGEGAEGGQGSDSTTLPPDLDFALKIAQIRGHLLVGDELVKEGQWAAALPHFLHPSEELYGPIQGRLKGYNTPPFAAALKALAATVKQKKGGEDYANALKSVEDALAAADAGVKAKQPSEGFAVETALELVKSATNEYEEAIVKGRIAKPVEYQDARGIIWQSEQMIEAQTAALEKKDAAELKPVRDGFAELKKAWPAAMPPKTPVKDYAGVLNDVSRIELAIGKLM